MNWKKNFSKNSICISCQVPIYLGLKELSEVFALSLREKGNNFNFMVSSLHDWSWKVEHASSNSLKCREGLLESKPWNLGSNEIILGLKIKLFTLVGKIMHDGALLLIGYR